MQNPYGNRLTEAWKLYELGRQYNNNLTPNQYDLVDTNIEFFIGNQWKGLSGGSAMSSLPKPVFNIIKRICALFVASLTASATTVSFEPLTNKQEGAAVAGANPDQQMEEESATRGATMATEEVLNLFEKLKLDYRIRDAMFDGVQTGDYCAHFYWDANAKPYGGAYGAYRGEIKMELVDGINVMFGNPGTPNVEAQPYIIVYGRDLVKNLKDEYMRYGKSAAMAEQILPDNDSRDLAGGGGKIELGNSDETSKASFIYKYWKETREEPAYNPDGTPKMEIVVDEAGKPVIETTGRTPVYDAQGQPVYKMRPAIDIVTTVHVSKHTKFVDIIEDVDTGLSYYPIAWGNWEKQKNQYHGRALVTGIIPNQIYINSMFALVMRHQQMLGFPKTLYDANVIGQWNNAVGQAIAVYDLPPEKRMNDLYGVIQPADMSTQIMNCIERAMEYTKECLGATDAQLGNVRPDNTSAIIALQSSSQVPLENPQSNKYEWVEDIGRILLDMMGTYYGSRPVVRSVEEPQQVIDPTTGMPTTMIRRGKVVEMFDFSQLKHLWLNVRADVGASTYWSRIAIVQTLDNLKQSGVLDVIDYLERMPDEYVPRKDELLAKLRRQLSEQVPTDPALSGQDDPGSSVQGEGQAPSRLAFAADAKNNEAALVAAMPANIQNLYNTLGTRAQKTLVKQARLTTPGI